MSGRALRRCGGGLGACAGFGRGKGRGRGSGYGMGMAYGWGGRASRGFAYARYDEDLAERAASLKEELARVESMIAASTAKERESGEGGNAL